MKSQWTLRNTTVEVKIFKTQNRMYLLKGAHSLRNVQRTVLLLKIAFSRDNVTVAGNPLLVLHYRFHGLSDRTDCCDKVLCHNYSKKNGRKPAKVATNFVTLRNSPFVACATISR